MYREDRRQTPYIHLLRGIPEFFATRAVALCSPEVVDNSGEGNKINSSSQADSLLQNKKKTGLMKTTQANCQILLHNFMRAVSRVVSRSSTETEPSRTLECCNTTRKRRLERHEEYITFANIRKCQQGTVASHRIASFRIVSHQFPMHLLDVFLSRERIQALLQVQRPRFHVLVESDTAVQQTCQRLARVVVFLRHEKGRRIQNRIKQNRIEHSW